jgi:hypothetical protein
MCSIYRQPPNSDYILPLHYDYKEGTVETEQRTLASLPCSNNAHGWDFSIIFIAIHARPSVDCKQQLELEAACGKKYFPKNGKFL